MKQSKKSSKSHARAPGMTQVSISLPQRLVDKVDRLADFEKRSRSNYIASILEGLREEASFEAEPFLQAAEPKSEFQEN